ncbi:ATP phosphoribosyltransferase [Afifella marina]|uniref:ATP phosphoribosyltransferase n=1 Tax=Afifella marina DSM 2698 TaxID=1120955 RepID=A0A1G5MA33_AFIMA|nr:ATP phosphoribosyltransferase [Afifella marina]SCZ21611.1 ATP phosphoribosyltransferase catalytic subunit [Afifella marina DSM 2698]
MSETITLAIPSKGRLMEETERRLAAAGYKVARIGGARRYRGEVEGCPEIEIAFLSASEISRELGLGRVHVGVTGLDLIQETVPAWQEKIGRILPLGFGHADVVIAVPELWIDVATMEDLDDVAAGFLQRHGRRLRIATKYWNLTQRFLESHGIALYRIVESLGATEGAPAGGMADVIVDITSTGSTLKANHLKILDDGVILRSEACLVMSRRAPWSDATRRVAETLVDAVAQELNRNPAAEAAGSR